MGNRSRHNHTWVPTWLRILAGSALAAFTIRELIDAVIGVLYLLQRM